MSSTTPDVEAEAYRGELLGYCYRYFGCYAEASDAVQETMLRAWQHGGGFDGRSSLRTWLYRIATNVCLDMKKAPQRRSLPADLSSPGQVPDDPGALTTLSDATWIGPIADRYLADPADTVEQRDSVRLAFITVLQLLPPRQRVLLILRDVLGWSAQECADLLEITVASVNSALARARKTVAAQEQQPPQPAEAQDHDQQLLTAYVAAFAAYDVDRLVRLLTEDASFSMPPYELWLRGRTSIKQWWHGPGQICRNSRLIMTGANRQPAVAVYHDLGNGHWEPFALHVLDLRDDHIAGITHFMGPKAFGEFGLPPEVTETGG